MADFVNVRVVTKTTLAAFADIERRTNRATMWAVREAGRETKREARKLAPVYKGADAARRMRRGEQGPRENPNRPVKGLLRASINTSRRLRREGNGTFAVRVAPRGLRVHLYSQRIEAIYGYMRKAHDTVAPRLHEIARSGWARSTRGRR